MVNRCRGACDATAIERRLRAVGPQDERAGWILCASLARDWSMVAGV